MTWRRFAVLFHYLPAEAMSRVEMGQGWPFDREVAVATLERVDSVLGVLTHINRGVWNLPMHKRAKQAQKWDQLHVPRPNDPDEESESGVWLSIAEFRDVAKAGVIKGEVK